MAVYRLSGAELDGVPMESPEGEPYDRPILNLFKAAGIRPEKVLPTEKIEITPRSWLPDVLTSADIDAPSELTGDRAFRFFLTSQEVGSAIIQKIALGKPEVPTVVPPPMPFVKQLLSEGDRVFHLPQPTQGLMITGPSYQYDGRYCIH